MITVKDFIELKSQDTQIKEDIIDAWLEQEVFPSFTTNNQGFQLPEGITISFMEKAMTRRGFTVRTHSDYQGSFVYIQMPKEIKQHEH